MNRAYVICHMLVSMNGKTTGAFMEAPEVLGAIHAYESTNLRLGSRACLSGRLSMAEHFTRHAVPVLNPNALIYPREDYIADPDAGHYMVVVDTAGRLGWQSNTIQYMDRPAHHVVVLLTGKASDAYLAYLRDLGISYLLVGEHALDVPLALEKLKQQLGIDTVILSGGGKTNEYFLQAGLIDEFSLVVAPVISHDLPGNEVELFQALGAMRTRTATALALKGVEVLEDGSLWVRYLHKAPG